MPFLSPNEHFGHLNDFSNYREEYILACARRIKDPGLRDFYIDYARDIHEERIRNIGEMLKD